ncbi:phage protein GemA/Gp16 family protein [Thermodesulfobacteriota bacterium]
MGNTAKQHKDEKSFYHWQNRTIHKARAQLFMGLDDCRELARQINGKASLSSLSIRQRWELIEIMKEKGARVKNPPLSEAPVSRQGRSGSGPPPLENGKPAPKGEGCPVVTQERPEDVYPDRLVYWNKRFPKRRPGFASNEQLAWIQALWELDFNDGRRDNSSAGLRGFIYRQTMRLKQGPVSDLAFLRNHHVSAVMTPLKEKAKQNFNPISTLF